ncbi:hypothetical protein E6C27_scaffold133G00670 [Cucumis melo var. makuwa]|uniref:DUF4216 domain-containing protein n=1 Tax=Cucumis melo var. makuwa TaxID=1194695 RepID=A0A5A7U2C7_CUCMM|nr:hypothetical protein E6C27_scaffold133G00670 [Cucumis melo var. makuwa]
MVENYIVEEAIEFCFEFIAEVSSTGLNSFVIKRDSNVDRALSASSFIRPSKEQLDQAHLYVIQNVNDVLPYVEQHMESLRKLNSGKTRSKNGFKKSMIAHSVGGCLHGSGVKVDELGFTIVDLKCIGHKSDSFILATQAKQVFYVQDSANLEWMPNVDTPNETDDTNSTYIRHDCEGRWVEKEARKGRNNDYFDDAIRDCASRIDELVATYKNEDILTDTLGSKEHGGRVRGVGGFVSQSQYFNTVKGKKKMKTPQVEICHKEEDDLRCKSDKKRSNHSRSSIGSIHIDLDADEDLVNTPSNKGVEGTPCQLSVGSVNNIVAVATIVEDNIGCPNVKVLVDVITGENLTIPNLVKEKIETLNQALVFIGCCMLSIFVKIVFMFWTLFGVKSMKTFWSHKCRVEDMASETRSTTPSINSKMETCKVPSSIGFCRVWVLRAKFNTKNAYRQEEIDEIRTK